MATQYRVYFSDGSSGIFTAEQLAYLMMDPTFVSYEEYIPPTPKPAKPEEEEELTPEQAQEYAAAFMEVPVEGLGFMASIGSWFARAANWCWEAWIETSEWIWPFHYISGVFSGLGACFDWIVSGWVDFSTWVSQVQMWLSQNLSFDAIGGYFSDIWDMAVNAWEWVKDWWSSVWGAIGDWWDSTKEVVLSWIDNVRWFLLGMIEELGADLDKIWNDIKWFLDNLMTFDEIIDWWKNWLNRIITNMIIAGFARIAEVVGLIDSKFTEREGLWAGWQDMRDDISSFIADPLEFVWSLFEDWFAGPEE